VNVEVDLKLVSYLVGSFLFFFLLLNHDSNVLYNLNREGK